MHPLLKEIKQCTLCKEFLTPRPVLQFSQNSKILIIGQAPGRIVHETGIPWDDKSGEQLRSWLGVTKEQFYDPDLFGLIPMGFCYPGKGKSGDLPPRKECAPQWHNKILQSIKQVKLTLLIGKYAQDYYLGESSSGNLTENVKNYRRFLPDYLPLVHPSPRNNIWKSKNPWFEKEVIPALKQRVQKSLA